LRLTEKKPHRITDVYYTLPSFFYIPFTEIDEHEKYNEIYARCGGTKSSLHIVENI